MEHKTGVSPIYYSTILQVSFEESREFMPISKNDNPITSKTFVPLVSLEIQSQVSRGKREAKRHVDNAEDMTYETEMGLAF